MANLIRLSNRFSVNLDQICTAHLDDRQSLVVNFTSGETHTFVREEKQALLPLVHLEERREPTARPPAQAISEPRL